MTEVSILYILLIAGLILCDQAKMLDLKARSAQTKKECPKDIWNEAKDLVISFL